MTEPAHTRPSGLPHAIGCYLLWGLLPLYFRLVHVVPPFEFVGWRLVFTLPVCLIIVAVRRQGRDVLDAIANPRLLSRLLVSALLIGSNWLIYVWAIQSGHVFATSLGYYINPLMNVLAGTLFLGEHLTKRQWLAVAIASAGVVLLAWDAREMLGVAIALAVTFCSYGLMRRNLPVDSLPGLTVETALLVVPAVMLLIWQSSLHGGSSFGHDAKIDALIPMAGICTALPLLLFAEAARRMDYSTLGFIQFLSPTIVFLLGLFVFREPLNRMQLICFILIWTAAAVFVSDLFARRSR